MTCNNEQNKTKRMEFAKKLRSHMTTGDFIVYYDEINFNVYCKVTQGRAKIGKRATIVLPPSKGANLQVQCAVSTEVGLVHHQLERGSIRMCGPRFGLSTVIRLTATPVRPNGAWEPAETSPTCRTADGHSHTDPSFRPRYPDGEIVFLKSQFRLPDPSPSLRSQSKCDLSVGDRSREWSR
jgi:hypothetical protein